MIVTDMNDRERKAFAKKAEDLAKYATKLAESLRAGNDTDTLLHLTITSISGWFITDLNEVFHKAAGVQIPDDASQLATPNHLSGEDK